MKSIIKKFVTIICILAMTCSLSLSSFAESTASSVTDTIPASSVPETLVPEEPLAETVSPDLGTAEVLPIESDSEEVGLTKTNDTDPMVSYFLNWKHDTNQDGAYMRDAHSTSVPGATVSFSFSGGGPFIVEGKFGPDCGIARLYVDGADMGFIDFYAEKKKYSSCFVLNMSEGDHVVKLICTGDRNDNSTGTTIALDSIAYEKTDSDYLVLNGGFETIDDGAVTPANWDATDHVASTTAKVHTGTRAVLLKEKEATISQTIGVEPGKSYLLVGWVYARNPQSVIELGVKDHGQKNVYSVSNTADIYTCINVAFTTGKDARTATIYSTLQEGENSYVDDFKVIPIESTDSYKPLQNADSYQSIPTYDGKSTEGQPTHPSVLYFENGWNGYKYWMAMTPYPYNDGSFENPSIVVSDDGENWKVPPGVENPLVDTPVPGHNCDVDLVHYKDDYTDELRMYYVEANDEDRSWVKVLTSTDGIKWLERGKPVVDDTRSPYGTLSPSIEQLPDGSFMMWAVDTGYDGWCCQTNTVQYRTSTDGLNWKDPINCPNFVQPGYRIWHMDVHYNEQLGKYQAVYPAYPAGTNCDHCELFYAESTDGLRWTTFSKPILTAGESGAWDDFCIYRSSLLMSEDNRDVHVWYGAKREEDAAWHTGYSANSYVDFISALAG